MQNVNDILLEMGFEWAEIDGLSIMEKSFLLAWEEHDWNEVLEIHEEYGLGTPDEIAIAKRYLSRGA